MGESGIQLVFFMGHEPFNHFGPNRFSQRRIKVMGTGKHAGAVNYIIHPGWNTGCHTIAFFDNNYGFNQTLTLCQQLDKLFINGIDLLAKIRDIQF